MVTDNSSTQTQPQIPKPSPALKRLERLVGTWKVKGRESGPDGEIHGQIAFEWMEGGYFLVQHVDINHIGRNIRGTEYIGYDESNKIFKSYFFGNQGNPFSPGGPFEYVYEIEGETLTIWGGYVGSPAVFRGMLSDNNNTIAGHWEWPGGGYSATITRVR